MFLPVPSPVADRETELELGALSIYIRPSRMTAATLCHRHDAHVNRGEATGRLMNDIIGGWPKAWSAWFTAMRNLRSFVSHLLRPDTTDGMRGALPSDRYDCISLYREQRQVCLGSVQELSHEEQRIEPRREIAIPHPCAQDSTVIKDPLRVLGWYRDLRMLYVHTQVSFTSSGWSPFSPSVWLGMAHQLLRLCIPLNPPRIWPFVLRQ